MKEIDLGHMIGVAANLGVIAGIVFLGVELRQNNELMAAGARFNRLQIATASYTFIAGDPQFAGLLARTDQSMDGITAAEREQLLNFGSRVLLNQQWTYFELPRKELPIENWRRISQRAHWRLAWTERRDAVNPEFEAWIDEYILQHEGPP